MQVISFGHGGADSSGRLTGRSRIGTRVGALALVFLLFASSPAHADEPNPTALGAAEVPPVDELVELVLRLVCDLTGLQLLCPPPDPPPAAQLPTPPAPSSPATPSATAVAPSPSPAGATAFAPASPLTTSAPTTAGPAPSGAPPPITDASAPEPLDTGTGEAARAARRSGSAGAAERRLRLPTPEEVDFSPAALATAAGISILGMILLGFPAELFNKTLQANYSRLRRVLPWVVPKAGNRALAGQVIALAFSCAVAGLIGAFQKVHEWSFEGLAVTAVAIAFGFFVTVAVFEVAGAVAGAKIGLPPRSFRSYQGALPIVALFVGVSALGRLQPAYVYGHLAGSRWDEHNPPPLRGRALQTVMASVALLVVAIASWGGRAFVTAPFLTDLLAGVTLVGLNRLAFTLLPATFLDGHAIASYSRVLWVVVYAPILAVFLLLVVLPVAREAPERVLFVSLVLFVLFAGLSVAIWAAFRQSARREASTLGALP